MNALIIGATGLVGKEIVKSLLEDSDFSSVQIFVRRPLDISHPKLKEHIVNFDDLKSWENQLCGDVLFCAMGTTLKAAGSKEAQWKVDFKYPLDVAKASRSNGVKNIVLISSVGADSLSSFFYLRTKGELEEVIGELEFPGFAILRPSLLEGDREVTRPGEKISHFFLSMIPRVKRFSRLIPVDGKTVAKKAVEVSKDLRGKRILGPQELLF